MAIGEVKRYEHRTQTAPEGVTVQDLGYRWASCGKGGQLHFHWQVMLLPPGIIDYLIVHELVHLRVRHHTREFWRAMERAMPDWESRRRWLAERGQEFTL